MKTLNRSIIYTRSLPTKILQFGDGNFIRAFIDWMIHELNTSTDFNAGVTVVKARPGKGKLPILNEQQGLYTVLLNGIKNGTAQKESIIVSCIQKAINPYENFEDYFAEATNPELQFIISNTTEAGIVFDDNDKLSNNPQLTFPAKITALLYQRFKIFKGDPEKGLIFIPCELIDDNGTKLRNIVLEYSKLWGLKKEFSNWVITHNIFCNTLVDRIVSGYPKDNIEAIQKEKGYIDQLMVMGEHYHLFAIDAPEIVQEKFPAHKIDLNVIFTNNLKKYKTIKVRILNGAHTALVPVAYLYGMDMVQKSVENEVLGNYLYRLISEEICPTLDYSMSELENYTQETINRFKNPSIKHELISISLNSVSKYKTRVLPSVLEYINKTDKLPQFLLCSLASLILFYKGDRNGNSIPLNDNKEVLEFFKQQWSGSYSAKQIVENTLKNENFWGLDLTQHQGVKEEVFRFLETFISKGIKNTLKDLLK